MRPISSITKDWYIFMMKINSKFIETGVKNQLFKMIASTTWGNMSQTNTVNIDYKDIDEYDIGPIGDEDHDYCIIDEIQSKKKHYYVLLNNMNPKKFNLRLKPFITCAGRIKIAETMLEAGINNVMRCHTDGIVLRKPFTFKDLTIWAE